MWRLLQQQVNWPKQAGFILGAAAELQLHVTTGWVAEQARDGRMIKILNFQRVHDEALAMVETRQIYTTT